MDRNTFILNELNKQSVSTCNTFSHISTGSNYTYYEQISYNFVEHYDTSSMLS